MQITFDYNPETNEYIALDQKIIKDKPAKVKTEAQWAEESAEPQLTLEEGKYILNSAAMKLLGVEPGDRVDIKYKPLNGNGNDVFPIIGSSSAWGINTGNKITKGLSVSCKGAGRTLLEGYGDTFSFNEFKETPGTFILVGNKDREDVSEQVDSLDDVQIDDDLEDTNYNIDDIAFEL